MTAGMRSPEQVMRLERMGAMHATRLSFLRIMLRRARRDGWRTERAAWSLDARGFGHAVYAVHMPARSYSLVAFSRDLPADLRTDRVIAEAWDTSYVLYDGVPDAAEIARLSACVPLQEAGRFSERELVLSRANKSVRLFDSVVRALAAGVQPDAEGVEDVGYLMRTTAVYGNGKFGIADRDRIADRAEFSAPFQAEMLTVWLIRAFTLDLAEHCARQLAPSTAVALAPALRRRIGVGNSTGLGMAPFLVRHPLLLHRWMLARETALARVRALPGTRGWPEFAQTLHAARGALAHWHTDDPVQAPRIAALRADLEQLAMRPEQPWDSLYGWAESSLTPEGQEFTVSLLLEPHGRLIDDLCDLLSADEQAAAAIDGRMACGALRALIQRHYAWALALDLAAPSGTARFWYVSAEKLEPRLGERAEEPGADRELPLGFAHEVARLHAALPAEGCVAAFLLRHPEWRHVVRRVQIAARLPYAEIRDNLLGAAMRPIDLLRCKLAQFGAARFDPRSDRWLRITLFQGAPFPDDLTAAEDGVGRAA